MPINFTTTINFGEKDWLESAGDTLCSLTRCWNDREVTFNTRNDEYSINPLETTWKHTACKVISVILFPLLFFSAPLRLCV